MKNKNPFFRKFYLIAGMLVLVFGMYAQRPIGTWMPYMAYQDAILVAETPNKVFAVYKGIKASTQDEIENDGSLMAYSPADQSVKKYSKEDGLSDIGITHLAYNSQAKALVIVYGNSNIDILTDKGFSNISSIKNDVFLQNKEVNNMEMDGSNAYLSTAFGVVVVDLVKKEIKATYKLETNTRSVCLSGGFIYAATDEGVLKASTSSNLLDKNNWKAETLNYGGNDKLITKVLFYKGMLTFCQQGPGVFYRDQQGAIHNIQPGGFRQIEVINDQLILVGLGYISFFQGFIENTTITLNAWRISSYNGGNNYWVAGGTDGLIGIQKLPAATDYTVLVSGIKINSPKWNRAYYLTYSQGKLLVVGGGGTLSTDRTKTKGILMVYENKDWYSFDETKISQQSTLPCMDFTSAVVDPRDPNHYFVSSWGEGLYEFKNNEFVTLYNPKFDNTTLASAIPTDSDPYRFVRVDGLAFDNNNNLYMTNALVTNGINILSASNEWIPCYYPKLSNQQAPQHILINPSNNQKWVNVPRGTKGIFVVDEKNTIDNTFDDTEAFSEKFYDQQGYDINATGYFALAIDHNGIIWVGTDNGPILFNNLDQVKNSKCTRVIAGGADNPYRLLDGLKITAIAVDGGNRKWIGTEGSGVFCVEQDGEDITTENFTAENSMLISNNITSISINNSTGEIFIGTDRGLVSYMGEATEGQSSYSNVHAFPNPVRPPFDNQVTITGLMEKSTIKITDLNGNLIIQDTSAGGQYTWNCTKRSGELVKSGIYLVFASTPEGKESVVTKIMVIK